METQKMNDKPPNTLFGLSPATYGVASLAAALVALGSELLVVVVGVALAAVVMGLVVLLGVVSGLMGIGAGIYYKHLLAIVTGILGLVLIGFIVKSFVSALMTF